MQSGELVEKKQVVINNRTQNIDIKLRHITTTSNGRTIGMDESGRLYLLNTIRQEITSTLIPNTIALDPFCQPVAVGRNQIAFANRTGQIVLLTESAPNTSRFVLTTLGEEGYPISHLAALPKKTHLAAAHNDDAIRIWDIDGQTCMQTIPAASRNIITLLVSNSRLYIIYRDKIILAGQENTSDETQSQITCATLLGTHILTGHQDKHVRLWDTSQQTPACIRPINTGASVNNLFAFPDHQHIAIHAGSAVTLWDFDLQRTQQVSHLPRQPFLHSCFTLTPNFLRFIYPVDNGLDITELEFMRTHAKRNAIARNNLSMLPIELRELTTSYLGGNIGFFAQKPSTKELITQAANYAAKRAAEIASAFVKACPF